MTICIIPARAGSKRVPGKNIRPFAGRPMLHHAIEAARASGLFERIVVSTDGDAIALEARRAGAEVPFMRPAHLADDHTGTVDVIVHALKSLGEEGPGPVCCLYPACPLVQPWAMKQSADLMETSGAPCVFPVASFPAPVFRGLKRKPDGTVAMMWPEHRETRSNDLPEVYHDAGQFYFWDIPRFLESPEPFPEGSRAIVLPRYLVQDIDTEEDWDMAERLYTSLQRDGGARSNTEAA